MDLRDASASKKSPTPDKRLLQLGFTKSVFVTSTLWEKTILTGARSGPDDVLMLEMNFVLMWKVRHGKGQWWGFLSPLYKLRHVSYDSEKCEHTYRLSHMILKENIARGKTDPGY